MIFWAAVGLWSWLAIGLVVYRCMWLAHGESPYEDDPFVVAVLIVLWPLVLWHHFTWRE